MSMDKRITFIDDETGEESFLILKDTSKDEDIESIYMIVENEEELNEVLEKFKVLFEDTDIIIE